MSRLMKILLVLFAVIILLMTSIIVFNTEVQNSALNFKQSGFSGEWKVTINGVTKISNSSVISFILPSGHKYSYSISSMKSNVKINQPYGVAVLPNSAPYWISIIGIVAGGAAGGILTGGNPIGIAAGAIGGDLLTNYLYGLLSGSQQNANLPNPTNNIRDVFESVCNNLNTSASYIQTEESLINTSFYYFANIMESFAPLYLNQSYNLTQMREYLMTVSGDYATASKLLAEFIDPIDSILIGYYNYYIGVMNSYYSSTYPFYDANAFFPGTIPLGSPIAIGDYFFFTHSSDIFSYGTGYVLLKNITTGTEYNISFRGKSSTATFFTGTTSATATNPGYNITGMQMPVGMYEVIKMTPSTLYKTDGLPINPSTFAIDMNVANTLIMAYGDPDTTDYTLVYQTMLVSSATSQTIYAQNSYNLPSNLITIINDLQNSFTNAFTTADTYFNTLVSLGYTNASQLNGNQSIPLPSYFVPTSMLNGTFNLSELTALYYAYMIALGKWYNGSVSHNITNDKNITNATFTNGLYEEYGNLTLYNSTSKTYQTISNTWFYFLTNGYPIPFTVGKKTSFSAPVQAIVLSDPINVSIGELLTVASGSSFQTEKITYNGSSVNSVIVKPAPISVVLPHISNITVPSPTGGFFSQASSFLSKYYLIVTIGLLAIVGVAYVSYVDSQKKRGKE